MTKNERIELLINDPRTKFEAGCQDFLNGLNEDQLERLTPPDNVVVQSEQQPKPAEDKPQQPVTMSAAEWVESQKDMPKEVRDSLLDGLAINAFQREEMIESITKDPRNTFTRDQLQAKPTSELRALEKFVVVEAPKPATNDQQQFFGMRVGGVEPKANENSANKIPEPLIVESLEDRFKANLKR